jgi:hypothetical protein
MKFLIIVCAIGILYLPIGIAIDLSKPRKRRRKK